MCDNIRYLDIYFILSEEGQCEGSWCGEDRVVLNNGEAMPRVGLGTAGLTHQDTLHTAVEAAVASGYRMFGQWPAGVMLCHVMLCVMLLQCDNDPDTADLYSNHAQLAAALARALQRHSLAREDVFLVTKLRPVDLGGARSPTTYLHYLYIIYYLATYVQVPPRRAPAAGGAGHALPGPGADPRPHRAAHPRHGAQPAGAARPQGGDLEMSPGVQCSRRHQVHRGVKL